MTTALRLRDTRKSICRLICKGVYMTVKELFAQVEHERVTDAFILLDYTYSEENFENTFFEKYDSISRMISTMSQCLKPKII